MFGYSGYQICTVHILFLFSFSSLLYGQRRQNATCQKNAKFRTKIIQIKTNKQHSVLTLEILCMDIFLQLIFCAFFIYKKTTYMVKTVNVQKTIRNIGLVK